MRDLTHPFAYNDPEALAKVLHAHPGEFAAIAPIAFELPRIADLGQEIFGPVLHVVRWGGDVGAVIAQINALGYGLTLGIQTRIDSRARSLACAAHTGNIYINAI